MVPFSGKKQTINLGNEVRVVGMSWREQHAFFSPAMMWFSLMELRQSWNALPSLMPELSFLLKGSAGQTPLSRYNVCVQNTGFLHCCAY